MNQMNQTQNSEFQHWRSEAEHARFRSLIPPPPPTDTQTRLFTSEWRRKQHRTPKHCLSWDKRVFVNQSFFPIASQGRRMPLRLAADLEIIHSDHLPPTKSIRPRNWSFCQTDKFIWEMWPLQELDTRRRNDESASPTLVRHYADVCPWYRRETEKGN